MLKQNLLTYWNMLPKWMRNPYIIAIISFSIWMLFFDDNNMRVQWKRKTEIAALTKKVTYYENGIKETRQELIELTTNPETQEKFAREHYYMKRDNEDVYVFRQFENEQRKSTSWWQKIFQ